MDNAKPIPVALTSKNPARWLAIFGPGAIIASLTIGTGELIFSSRGGAIFGYQILFLFLIVCILKWVLVFSTARHMVLTGIHPLERWLELPGPRGWLPAVMIVFAVPCIPIWVSFHASVLGDLLAGITNTKSLFNGAVIHIWALVSLGVVICLSLLGGYRILERVQMVVVVAMLLAVMIALVLLRPDWWQMLIGSVIPSKLSFPDWVKSNDAKLIQQIAEKPVWEELALYVGVIGGAGYDYLAYTSFLRDKQWGLAKSSGSSVTERDQLAARKWIRAPLIDCTMSFLLVFVFSAVFVASGHLVLAPKMQIPGDGSFLEFQSQFLTGLHPWLFPLYVVGVALTMIGTLYGTLEVAPTIARETRRLFIDSNKLTSSLRRVTLLWCAVGASLVLVASFYHQLSSGEDRPPGLTSLLKPASLFTGVLSCGLICLLNPWMDRCLPSRLRPNLAFVVLNVAAGVLFLSLGMKGYWDYGESSWQHFGGARAVGILLTTVALGFVVASLVKPWLKR